MPYDPSTGSHGLRYRQAAFALAGVILVALLTVGLVLERQRHQKLGEQKAELETKARHLRSRLQTLSVARSRMLAHDYLIAQAARFNLGMTNITPGQRLFIERAAAPDIASAP